MCVRLFSDATISQHGHRLEGNLIRSVDFLSSLDVEILRYRLQSRKKLLPIEYLIWLENDLVLARSEN